MGAKRELAQRERERERERERGGGGHRDSGCLDANVHAELQAPPKVKRQQM